jgi:glycosyltransferase involved in cell wall biosynthesis
MDARHASSTHLVLIPSYNPGPKVAATVRGALDQWAPVWVVVDGSTDQSAQRLLAMASDEPGLRVLILPENRGKGAAVLFGMREAHAQGFTHALTMDSDGQHPPERIRAFMRSSLADPGAMVLGRPVFDSSAPVLRVKGRRISNWWANLETLWGGIDDSLYGFRVYPIEALIAVMRRQPWMRRFDFDVEAVVRLCWRGVRPINLPAPVRYFRPEAVLRLYRSPAAAARAALPGPMKRPSQPRVAACARTYIMPGNSKPQSKA